MIFNKRFIFLLLVTLAFYQPVHAVTLTDDDHYEPAAARRRRGDLAQQRLEVAVPGLSADISHQCGHGDPALEHHQRQPCRDRVRGKLGGITVSFR